MRYRALSPSVSIHLNVEKQFFFTRHQPGEVRSKPQQGALGVSGRHIMAKRDVLSVSRASHQRVKKRVKACQKACQRNAAQKFSVTCRPVCLKPDA